MIKQISTKEIDNLVGNLISKKFLHEHYKGDVFRVICDFLERRVGITIERVFTGKAYLVFNFEIMKDGNIADVKEFLSQELLESLQSIKYHNFSHQIVRLDNEELKFFNIESDYKSIEENQ